MSDGNLNDGEGYGRNWIEIAEEMEQRNTLSHPDRKLVDRLCGAERPQESIDAVLDEGATRFEHYILIRVRNNAATVWGARGWVDQTCSLIHFATSSVSGNPLELLTIHPIYRGVTPVEQAYHSAVSRASSRAASAAIQWRKAATLGSAAAAFGQTV